MADKDWRSGRGTRTQARRTQGGHKADAKRKPGRHKADTRRTQIGRKEDTKAEQGGRKTDKWRTRTEDVAKANNTSRTQGGHLADHWRKERRRGQSQQYKADKWRTRTGGAAKANNARWTHGGQAPETRPRAYRGQPFLPTRERPSKLFGEKGKRLAAISLGLVPGLCPPLACYEAGPWHHQVECFFTIAQPVAFILHAR